MARKIDALNEELRNRVKAGKPNLWSHGTGLCFALAKTGKATWVFRYSFNSKRRVMTLEPHADPISERKLKELEMLALECREQVAAGIDPLAERNVSASQPQQSSETFADIARDYIATHKRNWKNAKHADQWEATLETFVYPKIGHMRPYKISVEDVIAVLQQPHIRHGKRQPMWDAIPETASRVRMRVETVIAAAKSKGIGSGNPETRALWNGHHNPAAWRDTLQHWLGKNASRNKSHFAAMDWKDVPVFVAELKAKTDYSAKALLLTILCVTRTSETLNAKWSEFDLDAGIWTIPAGRMKAGREHRIPLSTAAIQLLTTLPRIQDNPHVFPGARKGKPLSNMAMLEVVRGMRKDRQLTVHGFRSACRDWISESTLHPDTIAEMVLAHTISDKTIAAYRRGDAFERRRVIMEQWTDYIRMNDNDYRRKWERFIA